MRLRLKAMITGALGAVLVAGPASAERVRYGVDFDAVPWGTFCPSVPAIPISRAGGSCQVSHPASQQHGRFKDLTGRDKNPPPNCEIERSQYRQWTTSNVGSRPWRPCEAAWAQVLKERSKEPERFKEPFDKWRDKWLGKWVVGDEK